MSDQGDTSVQKKQCRELPLERVVVFTDKAELKRKLQCELEQGVNEVHLENVTHHIIDDSIRVDGRGSVVIQDVQLRVEEAVHKETDSPKVAEIRSRFEAKQKQVDSLKDRVSVLQKIIEALDKIVESAGSNVVCPTKDSREPFILSNEALENLTNFYNFYDVSSTSVRSQLNDVTKSLQKSERELDALHRELHDAESHLYRQQFSRPSNWDVRRRMVIFADSSCSVVGFFGSIVITLESEKGGPVELDVFYQVDGATWRPRYELRVDTVGQRSLKVLSTAQPLLGGEIPKLGVLEAIFFSCPRTPVARHCFRGNNRAEPRSVTFGDVQEVQLDAPPMPMKPAMPSVGRPVENGLRAEFIIAKPPAIPSFGAEQKVTIGVIDVTPQLMYECVPSKNTGAFLIASAVNSSSLPILPGDAAVYVDNNFVAKTHMKNISPGERFSCCLGVDADVRVEYKPVKKYQEENTITNKTSTIYEQSIVVKNARAEPILLNIKEPIPRSTEREIKVSLINPMVARFEEAANNEQGDLTSADQLLKEGARMKGETLEWTISVQDGKSAELHVKYAVEHPKDNEVVFVEHH